MNDFESRAQLLVSGWHGWHSIRSARVITDDERAAITDTVAAMIRYCGYGDSAMKWIMVIWSGMLQLGAPISLPLLEDVGVKYCMDTSRRGRAWVASAKADAAARQPILCQVSIGAPVHALQAA
jgi:hypothetical protein